MMVLLASPTLAAEPVTKPPVPPGVDPGGVLIAIIGSGVDYTRPEIASRLARDGEGEIIGWDFADGDRRPYADGSSVLNNGPSAAALVSSQSTKTRLAVFRTPSDALTPLLHAVSMAEQSRVAIVVMAGDGAITSPVLEAMSGKLWEQLIVIAASPSSRLDASASAPANTIIVASCMPDQKSCLPLQKIPDAVEILVPVEFYSSGSVNGVPQNSVLVPPIDTAARIAALASRILTVEPGLTGAELKTRICALAKPFPDGAPKIARYGWIDDPAAYYLGK